MPDGDTRYGTERYRGELQMPRPVSVEAVFFESVAPDELAGFYAQGFGFAPATAASEDHIGLQAGNTYLGFDRVHSPSARRSSGAVTVWFKVTDVEATHRHLIALGATSLSAPDHRASPGEVLAKLLDPDGNPIGLIGPEGVSLERRAACSPPRQA